MVNKENLYTKTVSVILTLFFVILGVVSPWVSFQNSDSDLTRHSQFLAACGEGDTQKEQLDGCLADEGIGDDPESQADYLNSFAKGEKDRTSGFGYIINRIFTIDYLNSTELGEEGGETPALPTPIYTSDLGVNGMCDINHKYAGTPFYHNCDIPNFITGVLQSFTSVIFPSGISGGIRQDAKTSTMFLPSQFNDGIKTVPADPSKRTERYTALEVIGYNLTFTRYYGEWDDIVVDNGASTLSNWSTGQKLWAGAKGAWNGVVAGVSHIGGSVADGWEDGGFFGAIGGFFSGVFTSADEGAKAFVQTLADTIDLNIYRSWGWSRSQSYTDTLYNARRLTPQEKNGLIEAGIKAYLEEFTPKKPELPPEMITLKNMPDKVPTKTMCKTTTGTQHEMAGSSCGLDESRVEEDDFNSWQQQNGAAAAKAPEFGFSCQPPSGADGVPVFVGCVREEYEEIAYKLLKKDFLEKVADKYESLKTQSEHPYSEWIVSHPQYNPNLPSNMYVCTDEEGSDLGNGLKAFNQDGTRNTACGEVRPPVQNGFFGNGYRSQHPGADTRYVKFKNNGFFIPLIREFTASFSEYMFSYTSMMNKLTNAVIKISFGTPISDLGLAALVERIMVSLTNGVFFPLMTLAIAFSAFSIFVKSVRRGAYKESAIKLFMIVVVFVFGVIFTANPGRTINFVEKGPQALESVFAEAVWSNTADANDACTIESKTLDVHNVENTQRSMMCQNWVAFLVTPWTYAQWGTSLQELNSENFSNTNKELTGSGEVRLGGGKVVKNWGLYQLEQTVSGTTTTSKDFVSPYANPNIYRIVDMQYGPQNGVGRDAKLAERWSEGADPIVTIASFPLSIFAFIVIAFYSFGKLLVTFISTAMLMFLPVVMFMGIFDGQGRLKMKNYLGSIAGYMLQRVIYTTMLAIMLTIVIGIATNTKSYTLYFIATIAILWFFLSYRKSIMGMVMSLFGAEQTSPSQIKSMINASRPQSARNITNRIESVAKGAVSGALASAMTGDMRGHKTIVRDKDGNVVVDNNGKPVTRRTGGIGKNIRERANIAQSRAYNRARRKGFGGLESMKEAKDAVDDYAKMDRARSAKAVKEVNNKLSEIAQEERADIVSANGRTAFTDADEKEQAVVDAQKLETAVKTGFDRSGIPVDIQRRINDNLRLAEKAKQDYLNGADSFSERTVKVTQSEARDINYVLNTSYNSEGSIAEAIVNAREGTRELGEKKIRGGYKARVLDPAKAQKFHDVVGGKAKATPEEKQKVIDARDEALATMNTALQAAEADLRKYGKPKNTTTP